MSKFVTITKMAVADALIYRADILIFVLSGIVRPVVMILLWLAAIASGAKTPLSQGQFVEYYILAMIIDIIVGAWSAPFTAARIRDGRITSAIIRPLSYIHFDLGNNIGEKIFKFVYLIPILAVLIFFFKPQPISIPLFYVPFAFFSIIFAFAINYSLEICVGFLAFWTDEIEAIRETNDLFTLIFSGFIFPLAILPTTVQTIAKFSPYRYVLSFPIEILTGKLSFDQVIIGTLIGFSYSIILISLSSLAWNRGVKKYSAIGG